MKDGFIAGGSDPSGRRQRKTATEPPLADLDPDVT